MLPIWNCAELNQSHNWLSSALQRFWLIRLICHMHLECFTNPNVCISPDFRPEVWAIQPPRKVLRLLHEIWILTWQRHILRGTKINASPPGNADMCAESPSNPCDSRDQRDGPADRRRAVVPSRQTDRWGVRQSRASASAFALWDFKWGVMCSQVCLYWPFHSSSKAIQLNQNWGGGKKRGNLFRSYFKHRKFEP